MEREWDGADDRAQADVPEDEDPGDDLESLTCEIAQLESELQGIADRIQNLGDEEARLTDQLDDLYECRSALEGVDNGG